MMQAIKPTVNEFHHRQDIGRQREFDLRRGRYRFASKLLPSGGPGRTLCDVGGGAGEFCLVARQMGYVTTLVDGNPRSVENERQRGCAAVQVDLTRGISGVADSSFDVVTCLEVIEHIVTAELLLQEMARILKDEGKLILSTPNFAFLRDRLVYLVGADAKEEGYHFRFYTQHKLAAMCRAAGFRIEATNSMGSPLGLNFLLRMATLGRCRLAQFSCPQRVESWLAATFIWRLVKL